MNKRDYTMPLLRVRRFESVRLAEESKPLTTAKYDAQVSYTQIKAKTQNASGNTEVQ